MLELLPYVSMNSIIYYSVAILLWVGATAIAFFQIPIDFVSFFCYLARELHWCLWNELTLFHLSRCLLPFSSQKDPDLCWSLD